MVHLALNLKERFGQKVGFEVLYSKRKINEIFLSNNSGVYFECLIHHKPPK